MEKKIRDFIIGKDTNVYVKDEWIKKQLNSLKKDTSILDAGAGQCQWKKYCAHLKYTAQDFSQYDGKQNNIGLHNLEWTYDSIDIVSDITDIPVKDNSFEAVLCTEVLEHVPDPNRALQELVRVTSVGGVLILTAPFCSLTHMAPYHYCSGFDRFWFEDNLRKYGAEIIECERNGDFYSWIRQEVTRLPSVLKRYNGKNTLLTKIICAMFAHWINKYIGNNRSGDLLCFEYMVVARKM